MHVSPFFKNLKKLDLRQTGFHPAICLVNYLKHLE